MNLPKDRNDWTENHLKVATQEMENSYDRYERAHDAAFPERSQTLFADYQRKAERVRQLRLVLRGVE